MDYRSQFSGLNEASVDGERLPSLFGKDGIYRLRVDRHAVLDTDNGLTFLAEVTVLGGNGSAPVGFRTSAVFGGLRTPTAWKRTKALGRVKAHLSAVWSIPADSNQDWVGIMQMCGDSNAAEGATFIAQTRGYTYTDDKGKEREGVEFTHAMDPENPLITDPRFAKMYAALRAS